MQVARNLGQFEAVRNGKRKHDVVFGGCRLQLEVELAAEAFAQCQTPGAVDAAAIEGMDHQLHAPGFVEESLEYERALCRHAPKSSPPAMQIVHELRCGGRVDAHFLLKPALSAIA